MAKSSKEITTQPIKTKPSKEVYLIMLLGKEIDEAFTIQLRSDGILHSHISTSLEFNIESLKKFNIIMGQMVQFRMTPLLITLDEFALPSAETRIFWAKKESCPMLPQKHMF
jgi:hypothetical protein